MKKFIIVLLLFVGCHPVSHIMIGDIKEPISPLEVKIYLNFPEKYETIALIEASSEFAFKDPSINITWQSKSDKIIERLKIKASSLGANAIVIKNTENKTRQNVTFNDEQGGQVNQIHFKVGTATAIFIKKFPMVLKKT